MSSLCFPAYTELSESRGGPFLKQADERNDEKKGIYFFT